MVKKNCKKQSCINALENDLEKDEDYFAFESINSLSNVIIASLPAAIKEVGFKDGMIIKNAKYID